MWLQPVRHDLEVYEHTFPCAKLGYGPGSVDSERARSLAAFSWVVGVFGVLAAIGLGAAWRGGEQCGGGDPVLGLLAVLVSFIGLFVVILTKTVRLRDERGLSWVFFGLTILILLDILLALFFVSGMVDAAMYCE